MSRAGALVDLVAASGGATARNLEQDLNMRSANPLAVALVESSSRSAAQVGHLQGRGPTHLSSLGDLHRPSA